MAKWENLGYSLPSFVDRTWTASARRFADGQFYIYSGLPDNDLVKFDHRSERVVTEKAGNHTDPYTGPAWTTAPSHSAMQPNSNKWFPADGSLFPAPSDNGFSVWDQTHDELWVSCVNPYWYNQLNIYSPATGSWRAVVSALEPTFNYPQDASITTFPWSSNIQQGFNPSSDSNGTWCVIYGGQIGGVQQSHLTVMRQSDRTWYHFPNHGTGAGKPGITNYAQNQLSWCPWINAFVFIRGGSVWTLTQTGTGTVGTDWVWTAQTTTGSAPVSTISMPLYAHKKLVVADKRNDGVRWHDDIHLLDTQTTPWTWSLITPSTSTEPAGAHQDGGIFVVGDDVYLIYGQQTLGLNNSQVLDLWVMRGVGGKNSVVTPDTMWYGISVPTSPVGFTTDKHTQIEACPLNNRLYQEGGDANFSPSGFGNSYRQETVSCLLSGRLSAEVVGGFTNPETFGWRTEYPYCAPDGTRVQPKHPDPVGWRWDSTRNQFWMQPGLMVASIDVCAGETTASASDLQYRFQESMRFQPFTLTDGTTIPPTNYGTWQSVTGATVPNVNDVSSPRYVTYDAATDQLIRCRGDGLNGFLFEHASGATPDTWVTKGPINRKDAAGNDLKCFHEYQAFDPVTRSIYLLNNSGTGPTPRPYHLIRYNIDTFVHTDLGATPFTITDGQIEWGFLVWNSAQSRLMHFHIYDNPATFWAIDPSTTPPTYVSLPVSSNRPGYTADTTRAAGDIWGLWMAYDPKEDVTIVSGGESPQTPSPYLWLFRYTGGGPPPPVNPVLTSLSWSTCVPGDTMTCTGTNLNPASATMRIENVTVTPTSIGPTQVVFTVPNLPSGTYRTWVSSPTIESNKLTFVIQYLNRDIHAIPFIGVFPAGGGQGG